ncbi:MAG: rRNA maturation RNase YbeY [Elusimicrobia bacterium]|nr:rRNA maturation RNase YbeY [Elusimicrobiota bacterium]
MFRTEFFSEVKASGLNIKKLKNFTSCAVKALKLKSSVNIILTDAKGIKKLNRRFFSKTGLTDVIAFDLGKEEPFTEKLCEVFVCLPAARKAALSMGHGVVKELEILIAHGLLHLSGMDDATGAAKKKMLDEGNALVEKLNK